MKNKRFVDRYYKVQAVGVDTPVPYYVWSILFENRLALRIFGDQIQVGGADYCSLQEARAAIDWLVNELGGDVKWEKLPKDSKES